MTIIGYILSSIALFIAGLVAFLYKYKAFDAQHQEEPLIDPVEPLKMPVEPVEQPKLKTMTEQLYDLSKSLLGTRLGRDKSIPWMVNCANACTDVLIRLGVKGLPTKGIAGTSALLSFLEDSPEFSEVQEYTPGAVIIAATGTGNGRIRGHVGICGNHVIMSNNSESGFWDDHWDWTRWNNYYTQYGGIPTRFFIVK